VSPVCENSGLTLPTAFVAFCDFLKNFATEIWKMWHKYFIFKEMIKTMLYCYITNWLKSDQKMKYNSVFFHHFGTGAGAVSIGKNSDKTGKLGKIHTTSFSLKCLFFLPRRLRWTSVNCSLTLHKKIEIFWFDSFVLLFVFLHYTYYYVTTN
jgi:hypothetical protein